ncbi:flagellar hook-length control protein FliK [Aestuariirhabdus sp. Z084]|uniref:flagellar hook-length control protein FliK n=1 Tax=Aestuariirhabdus haliotis TaxID=2918751 RepID=UPI00201B421D|nr:flagellar hook-length control protein FliK [Aestuariirhabdus haliotis]MCL6414466.1 flagellar hook-length control protein FliK [Aestuariirhabdus haliotis]MCL6418552.1 flagellar hook-length control protein FliK [Aestuariirhabdus haliotis]
MQNGTALLSFTATRPTTDQTTASGVMPGSGEAQPVTFTPSQLADLKENLQDMLPPEVLAQLFPEGLDNLSDEQFSELLAQLPPFVQQALQALQSGKALPEAEQPLPSVGSTDENTETAAAPLAAPVSGTYQAINSAADDAEDKSLVSWVQTLRPLSGQQEKADIKSRTDPLAPLATITETGLPDSRSSGELGALLQRNSSEGKALQNPVLAPIEGLSSGADTQVQTNVVPMANGYAIQTREVQPGGQQHLVTEITQPVGTARWGEAVVDKVMWLSSQNVQSAQIRLDPPELGPLEVKININSEQASVVFTSQHGQVRDALEQQLLRLREMFDQQGLQLVNVDVSQQNLAQQQSTGDSGDADSGPGGSMTGSSEDDNANEEAVNMAAGAQSLGLVDYYA